MLCFSAYLKKNSDNPCNMYLQSKLLFGGLTSFNKYLYHISFLMVITHGIRVADEL